MQRPRRILAAIPPSELGAAVAARAFAFAGRFGASVHLFGVVYDPYLAGERFSDSPELEAARSQLVAARRDELAALANAHDGDGIGTSVSAEWCYPVVDGVLQAVADYRPDLIVAGTFHHSPLQRFGLVNTDWQLIRQAEPPLLLVRSAAYDGYQQVMVAVDPVHEHDKPAALDASLLSAGQLVAEAWEGQLHVLHAYLSGEYVPFVAPGAAVPPPFSGEPPETIHRRALDELLAGRGPPDTHVLLETGDPRQVVPETAARLGAKLVVMGAVARSRLRRWLVGSTAESVLDRLDCDVLIIKPAHK